MWDLNLIVTLGLIRIESVIDLGRNLESKGIRKREIVAKTK